MYFCPILLSKTSLIDDNEFIVINLFNTNTKNDQSTAISGLINLS